MLLKKVNIPLRASKESSGASLTFSSNTKQLNTAAITGGSKSLNVPLNMSSASASSCPD